ncbi:MAG: hypothetical protein AAFX56_12815 [Pseudomonadota bacterium]
MSKGLPYAEHLTDAERAHLIALNESYLDNEALWNVLGRSIEGHAATGEEPDGKGAFNRQLRRIKDAICKDQKIIDFIDGPHAGDVLAIAMVCTAKLASVAFAGIDICAMGLLIARIGVRQLCRSDGIE